MDASAKNESSKLARGSKVVLFRLAAVFLSLLVLVLAEAVLVVMDVGRPDTVDDPFVGFSSLHPLFVLEEKSGRLEIARSRLEFFRPDSFAAQKGPSEFRIFCLGGSTVQGRPYSIETSMTTWLQIDLESADPSRQWEVVNCGGVSYASYRLVPILEELLGHEPDLFILYTGHNEFLEERTYEHIKRAPWVISRPHQYLTRLRSYTLIREAVLRLRKLPAESSFKDRSLLGPEVDALLDHRGGLEFYHRDEDWRRGVIENYQFEVRRMIRMAKEAGVPLILVNPVSNLRDSAPVKSEHAQGLRAKELRKWEELRSSARNLFATDLRKAVSILRQAIRIDDRYAGIHYDLAQCYLALGRFESAKESFVKAKELDVCPLRMLEPMHEALRELARETKTPLVDVRAMIARVSRDGIPGDDWLLDHVHPSILGHQRIANILLEEMVRQGHVNPSPGWQERRLRRYGEYRETLSDIYYFQGRKRLQGLRRWARGQADLPPLIQRNDP